MRRVLAALTILAAASSYAGEPGALRRETPLSHTYHLTLSCTPPLTLPPVASEGDAAHQRRRSAESLSKSFRRETSALEQTLEKTKPFPFMRPDLAPDIPFNVSLKSEYGFPPEQRDERYERTAREAAGNVASALLDTCGEELPLLQQVNEGVGRAQAWADKQRVSMGRGSLSLALNFNAGSAIGLKYKNPLLHGLYAELYPRGVEVKLGLAGSTTWKIDLELYHRFRGGDQGLALVFTKKVE